MIKLRFLLPPLLAVWPAGASLLCAAESSAPQSIPFSELGARATADYHGKGDAIGIEHTADGARLRTAFQKLAGTVTPAGLVLASTGDGGGQLRLVADAIGRTEGRSTTGAPAGGRCER